MFAQDLQRVLEGYVTPILAMSILNYTSERCRRPLDNLEAQDGPEILAAIDVGIRLYVTQEDERRQCLAEIERVIGTAGTGYAAIASTETTIKVREDGDVVVARTTGSDICRRVGFSASARVKVATVISELARNIVLYAGPGGGEVVIEALDGDRRGVQITARDQGPGLDNVDQVLNGTYRSKTGMGRGLLGTKRLMDDFKIATCPGLGTTVTVRKYVS
jgi:serine/threonine-protein kinase RsbT